MSTAVIVSRGSRAEGRAGAAELQALSEAQEHFSVVSDTLDEIQTTLSTFAFRPFVTAVGGDIRRALLLYRWNNLLAHSLYWPIQTLEVATRNCIANILTNSFGQNWHVSQKFLRQLDRDDLKRLREVVSRHQRDKRMSVPPIDGVVSELTFGFWTTLLTRRYAIPLALGRNLRTAFPHLPKGLGTESVLPPMERTRVLRNRIAHHEPIFDRKLNLSHREILEVLGWICPGTKWYVEQTTTFPELWERRPR